MRRDTIPQVLGGQRWPRRNETSKNTLVQLEYTCRVTNITDNSTSIALHVCMQGGPAASKISQPLCYKRQFQDNARQHTGKQFYVTKVYVHCCGVAMHEMWHQYWACLTNVHKKNKA
jgi:hypothetical protein